VRVIVTTRDGPVIGTYDPLTKHLEMPMVGVKAAVPICHWCKDDIRPGAYGDLRTLLNGRELMTAHARCLGERYGLNEKQTERRAEVQDAARTRNLLRGRKVA
jgi:hypothetical protein